MSPLHSHALQAVRRISDNFGVDYKQISHLIQRVLKIQIHLSILMIQMIKVPWEKSKILRNTLLSQNCCLHQKEKENYSCYETCDTGQRVVFLSTNKSLASIRQRLLLADFIT